MTFLLRPPLLSALLPVLVSALLPAEAVSPRSGPTTVTISPLYGTPAALPGTQISFLGAAAADLRRITVIGSSTGRHYGRLRSYVSALGTSFIVRRPFAPGEHVRVRATLLLPHGRRRALFDSFTIATPVPISHAEFPINPGSPKELQSFVSRPDLHPSAVTIYQSSAITAPGYVFGAPFQGVGQYGPMIFDNAGHLVWFHPVPSGQDAANFKVQRYHGANVLTWWQGHTISLGMGLGEDVIANHAYRTLAIVKAGNGLEADEHEFTVTPNGTAFITAYSPVKANLSSAGGPPNGIAIDCAIQEIDIRTGLVMWEWHALGHVDVSESYSKAPTTPTTPYDYFHLNSIELLPEGNFLISARNTSTIYKLSAHTGAILWRLGGKRSTFTIGPGVQFAYQHDARELPNGQITLFDDEGAPAVKPPSRGEVLRLESRTRKAMLVGSLIRSPDPLTTESQGDVQTFPDGRRMVGWGGLPNFTEFNSTGATVFDGKFAKGEFSYRVYRFPWTGKPSDRPAVAAKGTQISCLVARSCPPSKTTVYLSWNGATDVAAWRVLAGSNPSHLAPAATVPRSGFETSLAIPPSAYVSAQALDATGNVLASSPTVKPK